MTRRKFNSKFKTT